MTSIREQILSGIQAALAIDPDPAELDRMPPGDPASFPALHIIDDGQGRQDETEAGVSRFDMSISIEGFVSGAGSAMHAALNALQAATMRAVMGFGDTSPLIEEIREGNLRIAGVELGSKRRLAFAQDFLITFPTRRGDPETV